MQQSVKQSLQSAAKQLAHPRRLEVLFHLVKTFRLLVALLKDRSIHPLRKAAFLGLAGALLLILLLPDVPAVLGTVLPFVGAILGVPLDAGIDWIAFSLLLVSLLRIFPAERVAEHYQGIFRKEESRGRRL
ncbi:MAG: hypothetical protein IMW89_15530 [Ktedonobacteraceae bacterium]|nr:hypothetical protein [Ktedonobacteraceae bacterium]